MHCICCRKEVPEGSSQLCEVCNAWNSEAELIRRIEPVWQRVGQYGSNEEIEQMVDLFEKSGIYKEEEIDWNSVLGIVLGKELTAPKREKYRRSDVEVHSLFFFRNTAQRLANPLFNNNNISSRAKNGVKMGRKTYAGRSFGLANKAEVYIDQNMIEISGQQIFEGSGNILLQVISEYFQDASDPSQIAIRFNQIHAELCGQKSWSEESKSAFEMPIIRTLFTAVGDPNLPPTDYKRFTNYLRKSKQEFSPPPLCTWNEKGYLMGLRTMNERKLLPLPKKLHLLERFVRTWKGRYGMEATKKLRTACYCLSFSFANIGEGVPLTPHERSFQLLNSVVLANSERIKPHKGGLFVKGTSGFWWWINHGVGAHGSECVLAIASPEDDDKDIENNVLKNRVCLYESDKDLPLGDRICSNVLGILNDQEIAIQIPQVGYALASARMEEKLYKHLAEI